MTEMLSHGTFLCYCEISRYNNPMETNSLKLHLFMLIKLRKPLQNTEKQYIKQQGRGVRKSLFSLICRKGWLSKHQLVPSSFPEKYVQLTGLSNWLCSFWWNRKCLPLSAVNIYVINASSLWAVCFGKSLGSIYRLSQGAQWLLYIVPTQLKCVPVSVHREMEAVEVSLCNPRTTKLSTHESRGQSHLTHRYKVHMGY